MRARVGQSRVGQSSKRQALTGAKWGLLSSTGVQLLSTAATVVLTHLLAPTLLGVAAAAATIASLFAIVGNIGFGQAVLRAQGDREVAQTLFWATFPLTGVLAAILILGRHELASVMGLPSVSSLLPLLAVTLIVETASSIPLALAQRMQRYKGIYAWQLASGALAAGSEIAFARLGLGAASIPASQFAGAALFALGIFRVAEWRPRFVFASSLLREHLTFGATTLLVQGLTYGLKNVDYFVVGRTLGAAALGSYYLAFIGPTMLRQRVSGVVTFVLAPIFADKHYPIDQARATYTRALNYEFSIAAPLLLLAALLAKPLVATFLGSSYASVAEALPGLSCAALLDLMAATSVPVAMLRGRLRRAVVSQVLRLVIFAALLALVVRVAPSIGAVAWAVAASSFVGLVAQHQILVVPMGLAGGGLLRLCARSLALCGLMAATIALVLTSCAGLPPVLQLLVAGASGVAVYVAGARVLFPLWSRDIARAISVMIH